LFDGEAADASAAGGVEFYKLLDDLRRWADMWARSAVTGREAASVTNRFAGL
jgi:hypothetical protein